MNVFLVYIYSFSALRFSCAYANALTAPEPMAAIRRNYETSEESVPRSPKIAGQRVLYIPSHLAQELRSLECEIQGTPTPRVAWTKDGQAVHPPYKTKFNVTDGKAELEFPEHTVFEKSFEGNYSCITANFLGYDMKSFIITPSRPN